VVRFSGDVEKREYDKREKGRDGHKRTGKEQGLKAPKLKTAKHMETKKNVTTTTTSAPQQTMKAGTGVPLAQNRLVKLAALAFSRRTAET